MTYDEMEDISFRVSKLEDMIKGNVKIDDLVKFENNMASKEDLKRMGSKDDIKRMSSKEDLKGMSIKEYLQDLNTRKIEPKIRPENPIKNTVSSNFTFKLQNLIKTF